MRKRGLCGGGLPEWGEQVARFGPDSPAPAANQNRQPIVDKALSGREWIPPCVVMLCFPY